MAGKAAAAKAGVKAKGKKRSKKDPNAPKRALSAYMYFAKEKREEFVKKNPSLKSDISRMGKLIGESWSKLNPEGKAKFDRMAAVDKARYEKEITDYKKKKN